MGEGRGYNTQESFSLRTIADAERAINLLALAVRGLSGGYEDDGTLRIYIGGAGSTTYFTYDPATKTLRLYLNDVASGKWIGE